jgi:hypothetical protein
MSAFRPATIARMDQAWAEIANRLDVIIDTHRSIRADGRCSHEQDMIELLAFLIGVVGVEDSTAMLAVAIDRAIRET